MGDIKRTFLLAISTGKLAYITFAASCVSSYGAINIFPMQMDRQHSLRPFSIASPDDKEHTHPRCSYRMFISSMAVFQSLCVNWPKLKSEAFRSNQRVLCTDRASRQIQMLPKARTFILNIHDKWCVVALKDTAFQKEKNYISNDMEHSLIKKNMPFWSTWNK